MFGLTVDDIEVASFHGTSTTANDINETHVLNMQMEHLGRTKGNILPAVMQKYLTGHPKGAAAAWMLNGVLQVLDSGIVPGNRNADNIDEKLKEFDYVHFPSRSIQTDGVKAGLLKRCRSHPPSPLSDVVGSLFFLFSVSVLARWEVRPC